MAKHSIKKSIKTIRSFFYPKTYYENSKFGKYLIAKDGASIYYQNKFVTNKPIFFVHGLTGNIRDWDKLLRTGISKNYILMDIRGHGLSANGTAWRFSIENAADDMYQILKKERITKINLVAHSFGSLVAIKFAEKYPNKINKIVLLSPEFKPSTSLKNKLWLGIFKPVLKYGKTIWPKLQIKPNRLQLTSGKKNDVDIQIINNIRSMRPSVWLDLIDEFLKFDATLILPKIKVPVLLVHGIDDKVIHSERSRQAEFLLPNSTRILLPENHHLPFNKAKTIAKHIILFFGINY